jgi:hypothetical protein
MFCEVDACYIYYNKPTPFNAARQACIAAGGDLPIITSAARQQTMEQYFRRRNTLPYYWMGINRSNKQLPYQRIDGEDVPQTVSSDPYTHWVSGWCSASSWQPVCWYHEFCAAALCLHGSTCAAVCTLRTHAD